MQLDASLASAVDLSTLRRGQTDADAPPDHPLLGGGEPEAFSLGLGVSADGATQVVLGYGQDQWLLNPDTADELADALKETAADARTTPPPSRPAAAANPATTATANPARTTTKAR